MRNFYVKTRNWNANKKAFYALKFLAKIFGIRFWPFSVMDVKLVLETPNALKAWLAWACFMALRPLTGGWTYIIRPDKSLDDVGKYKSIY